MPAPDSSGLDGGGGGLSQAFAAAEGGKKRGLSSLTQSPTASARSASGSLPLSGWSPQQPFRRSEEQQPGGAQQQRLQGSGGSGSSFQAPLSPASTATPHSTTPLSDTLGISASSHRAKVARRPAGPFGGGNEGSDESDEDDFPVGAGREPTVVSSMLRHMHSSLAAPAQRTRAHHKSMDIPYQPAWSLGGSRGAAQRPVAGAVTGAMSMPHHSRSIEGPNLHHADLQHNTFRPGSVMEGAGRKLSGTEAMRMRNQVLRQTGFLEPHTNHTQMFADHEGLSCTGASPM